MRALAIFVCLLVGCQDGLGPDRAEALSCQIGQDAFTTGQTLPIGLQVRAETEGDEAEIALRVTRGSGNRVRPQSASAGAPSTDPVFPFRCGEDLHVRMETTTTTTVVVEGKTSESVAVTYEWSFELFREDGSRYTDGIESAVADAVAFALQEGDLVLLQVHPVSRR